MLSKSQTEKKLSKKKEQISMSCNRKGETIKGKLVLIIRALLTERPRNTIGVVDHELRTKKKRKLRSEKEQERQQMMARTQLALFDKTIDESDKHNNEREEDSEIPIPILI